MIIRKSTVNDSKIVAALLLVCFGDRVKYGAINNLEDRYFLAFEGNQLVAMTGLQKESPLYYGSEIDWTCVLPEYRGRGIITNLMSMAIKECDNDIYCSCLRLHDNTKVNLDFCMKILGFELVQKAHKRFCALYNKECDDCVYKTDGDCICCEDLYIRRNKSEMNCDDHLC